MSYFDTLNLADRIRCPVFLGVGLQDDVCPPATIFAVYNRISSPKEFRVYPRAQHWVGAAHDQERWRWMTHLFDETH
jgi:cephalosporin-C deacetylase